MLPSGIIRIKKQRKHDNIRIKDGSLLLDYTLNFNIMGDGKFFFNLSCSKDLCCASLFLPPKSFLDILGKA